MKEKFIALLMCLVLVLSMAGCGAEQAQEPKQSQEQPEQSVSVPSAKPTEQPAEPSMDVQGVSDENVTAPKTDDEVAGGEQPEESAPIVPSVAPTPEVVPVAAVDPFTSCDEMVYVTGSVNLRAGPGTSYEKVGGLSRGDSAHRVGIGTGDVSKWSRLELDDGSLVYVSSKYVSTEKPAVQTPAPKQQEQQQAKPAVQSKAPVKQEQSKPAKQAEPAPTQQQEEVKPAAQEQQAQPEQSAPAQQEQQAAPKQEQQAQQVTDKDGHILGIVDDDWTPLGEMYTSEEIAAGMREAIGITEEEP